MSGDPNWSVEKELLWKVAELMPVGGTVLELGSGYSTQWFVDQGCTTYSVEHDTIWLNKVPGAHYIHAPINEYGRHNRMPRSIGKRFPEAVGWYNPKTLRKHLPKEYDLILVDGPPRDFGRIGFYIHLGLFRSDVPIVLDDMHRCDDLWMARLVAEKLERDLLIVNNKQGHKPFGIIKP
jgi:hypothetical protein